MFYVVVTAPILCRLKDTLRGTEDMNRCETDVFDCASGTSPEDFIFHE